MKDLYLNGLYIEINTKNPNDTVVYIYDCMSDLKETERDSILNYLRAEGFIGNKIRCEIIRGEDYF